MSEPFRLILEKPLTVRWVAETKAVLSQAIMDGGGNVVLDLTAVTQVDGAGYQLLRALSQAAAAKGGSLRLEHLDEKVATRLRLAGGCELLTAKTD
jgi:anti-anti-sigma factor